MVTEVDVYQEIRRIQLEGVISKREVSGDTLTVLPTSNCFPC